LGVWISCLNSAIRYGMLIGKVGSVDLLSSTLFVSYLITHASYVLLTYIWASSYIIAHQKSNSWLWGIRIVMICWGLIFWIATFTDIFLAFGKNIDIIMGVLLAVDCIVFLVLARTLQVVAKKDEAVEAVADSVALKMSYTTYRMCFVMFVIAIIFLFVSSVEFGNLDMTIFVTIHGMYALMEVSLVAVLIVILHRKSPKSQNQAKLSSSTLV